MNKRTKGVSKKKKSKSRTKKPQDEVQDDISENQLGEGDLMNPDLQTQKDNDHISLNTEERAEVVTKALNSDNPTAPHNETKYSYKDKAFKKDELVDQMLFTSLWRMTLFNLIQMNIEIKKISGKTK